MQNPTFIESWNSNKKFYLPTEIDKFIMESSFKTLKYWVIFLQTFGFSNGAFTNKKNLEPGWDAKVYDVF